LAKAEPVKAEPAKTEPVKAEPVKAESPKPDPVKTEAPKPEATKVEKPPVVAAVKVPAPPASSDEKSQVTAAVEAWARAWSAKDVKGYLAFYAPAFEPPAGETRAAWEKARAERITKPKSIEVSVKIQSAKVTGDEAVVVLRQGYKSDALKTSSTKTLKLVRVGGQWLIKQERVGG
jgi:ketosteroid isomerase-like protein